MMGGGDNCPTVDICPDLILAGLAAAGAAAFFFIYQAITVKAGRRKRRSLQNFITSYDFNHVIDFFIAGKFYINVILENPFLHNSNPESLSFFSFQVATL